MSDVMAGVKKSGIMMGMGEVNYTPPVGLDLQGNYRGNDYASRGIHDSLYARAIVVKNDQSEKIAMLTVDVCWIKRSAIQFMREYIAKNSDIKAENIMIMATHTHSGPKPLLESPGAKEFFEKAASAVLIANQRLKPSKISVGRSNEARISFNRRLQCSDGSTHMCWEKVATPDFVVKPLGTVDPDVITVTVDQQGIQTGAIVNFGCHPATLTGNNWLYSADFPGYMVESMKRVMGKDFCPLFFNGPCGNVTQIDYKIGHIDTYQECQRIGYMLGVAAMESMRHRHYCYGNEVAVSRELVPLKHIAITDEQLNWAGKVMEKVKKEGMPPIQTDGIPDAQYAQDWMELFKVQNRIDSLEVMVVRIGDIAFVGLPGEMFSEFGIEIKKKSPFTYTLVMGLTNDNQKYFPTEVSFSQGLKGFKPMITGYETTPGTSLYDRGSGEKLTNSAITQLNKLFKIRP
ncbi:MAG: neutral/alkaline non-lysosomal ceramidase N-terminal domain-containing protein [Prolixibacteraceae bacterium]|nr:neutral/alkaline non-lysosomal ceramidase N-terminal domain-containing protein [Prolixibacteraceae bacterium]